MHVFDLKTKTDLPIKVCCPHAWVLPWCRPLKTWL